MDTDIIHETALTYTPPPEFNSSPLKNVNLEDDPFLLGFGHFSGAFAVKLWEGNPWE